MTSAWTSERHDGQGRLHSIVDYLCPASGRYHFKMMDRVLTPWEIVWDICDLCGQRVTVDGHRWATVTFIIREQPCVEDLYE